ncbi:MAG: hypothetical protein KIS96_14220 [Bauldia sp.]|nr:hypothetical protein [Bauldia sp.]
MSVVTTIDRRRLVATAGLVYSKLRLDLAAGHVMEVEKREEESRHPADDKASERPPAELHNPMNSFAFEPTDGGHF